MTEPTFKFVGLTELNARLGRMPVAVRDNMRWFVMRSTQTLRSMVKQNISDRFHSQGPLFDSIQAKMEMNNDTATGTVYSEGVPYAAIQEYGGQTRAHDIEAVRAKALAFNGKIGQLFQGAGISTYRLGFSSGNTGTGPVIRKSVHHPGSRLPERSYARTALYDFRGPFKDGMRAIVQEAIDGTAGMAIAAE
jgi:hypothetical protein